MEKNQNNDKRNQDKTDNKSTERTDKDYGKKVTDPNNPIANKDKQNSNRNTDDKKRDSITNLDKSKPGFKDSNQRDEETDEETPIDKTDVNKKTPLYSKQKDNGITNTRK